MSIPSTDADINLAGCQKYSFSCNCGYLTYMTCAPQTRLILSTSSKIFHVDLFLSFVWPLRWSSKALNSGLDIRLLSANHL